MTQQPNIGTREGQEQLRKMGVKPIPSPDDLTRPYWEAARKHELRLQKCKSCSHYIHPPEKACPDCGGTDMEWSQVSGKGELYSFIVDHRLMVPGFNEPYAVLQVIPTEAQADTVRITSNIRNCELEDIKIGMKLKVLFDDRTPEVTLPLFEPDN